MRESVGCDCVRCGGGVIQPVNIIAGGVRILISMDGFLFLLCDENVKMMWRW